MKINYFDITNRMMGKSRPESHIQHRKGGQNTWDKRPHSQKEMGILRVRTGNISITYNILNSPLYQR